MAHRATVFSPNDVARLRKLAQGLNEFVAKIAPTDGGKPVPAPAKRKPTGAAAHKSYLAKQAARKKKPGKPGDYTPVQFDPQQKQVLEEQGQSVPA